jgi:hypothetical protein
LSQDARRIVHDAVGLAEDMGIVRGIVKRFVQPEALSALRSLDGDKPARYEALLRAVAAGRDDAGAADVPLPPSQPVATVTSGPMPARSGQRPTLAPRRNPLGRYARDRHDG